MDIEKLNKWRENAIAISWSVAISRAENHPYDSSLKKLWDIVEGDKDVFEYNLHISYHVTPEGKKRALTAMEFYEYKTGKDRGEENRW